jgi:hypothetical protein
MKRTFAAVCFASILFFLTDCPHKAMSQEPQKTSRMRFSKQALEEDFLQMRQTLVHNHASLYEYTAKKVLDSLMDRQYGLIRDSMELREFFQKIRKALNGSPFGIQRKYMQR